MICNEAYSAADEVIEGMKTHGLDYSAGRELIALGFDEGLLEGNWDTTVNLDDVGLRSLRLIQEDEYDQHMDEVDDKPLWDNQLVYIVNVPAYVWFA